MINKRFILSVIFLLFQVLSFMSKAQCTDVTLSAISTPETCSGNGSITVTIGGADVGNLRLSDAEFKLLPNPTGVLVDWTTWTGSGVTRTYSTAVSGVYKLEMQALCQESPDNWIALSNITTDVIVGGNYTPMEFSVALRKSMNCKPTGEIKMNFTGGTPPYAVTVTAPDGYPEQTSFSTSSSTVTVDNVPPGDYSITAKDACNYTTNRTFTITTIANDVPAVLYKNMARQSGTATDCRSILPYLTEVISSPDADVQFYWNNSATYYEYAYLVNRTGDKNWTPLSNKAPVFVLPETYKNFCESGNTLCSYIRPAGCTTERCIKHDLSFICPNPSSSIFRVNTLSGSRCNTAKLDCSIPSYYGVCYPADWKITAVATPNIIIDSGTLLNNYNNAVISNAATSREYNRGATYTITLTDAEDREFTYNWTPLATQWQGLSASLGASYTYLYGYPCTGISNIPASSSFIYLITSTRENILPGTVIKYVSGPQTLGMGATGSTYMISADHNSAYFFPTGVDPYTNPTEPLSITTPGTYEFEITPLCGDSYRVSFTKDCNYHVQEITYIAEQTCEGLKVTPTGGLQLIDAAGQTADLSAYFRIISGTANDYTRDVVGQGEELILRSSGTYRIGMMAPGYQSGSCTIGTIDIVYSARSLDINPKETVAYFCEGDTAGFIKVQAVNGVAPYTYTVTSAPGTDPIEPQTNDTGVFSEIGVAGGVYNIEIKDACGTSFITTRVTMLDLVNTNIVYTVNEGVFCEYSEIQINCVALGNTTYQWTGPNGFTSTEQHPRLIANYPVSSGTYQVTVTPEGCPQPITQALKISVLPSLSPNVLNPVISACQGSESQDIVALSNISAVSDCLLKWYDREVSTTSVAAPTAHPTTTAGTTEYWISQVCNGCESKRKKITVTVEPCSCIPVTLHSNPITSQSHTLSITLPEPSHTTIYLTDESGNRITRVPYILNQPLVAGAHNISLANLFQYDLDPLTPYILAIETEQEIGLTYLYISKR